MTNTLDEAEYRRLQSAVSDAERILGPAGVILTPNIGADSQTMKQRMDSLEKDGVLDPDQDKKRSEMAATSLAIAALVAQESRLDHSERQQYADFLRHDYFRRTDFNKLDAFYADDGAWDRLSDDGKKEMSQRFWSGVEQGEYQFEEAPSNVRKKEADQLAIYIKNPEKAPDAVQRMSPASKEEFIQAYDSGDKTAAQEILNSKEFFESSPKEKTQAAMQRSEVAASRDGETKADRVESRERDNVEDTTKDSEDLASLGDLTEFSPTALPKNPAGHSQVQI